MTVKVHGGPEHVECRSEVQNCCLVKKLSRKSLQVKQSHAMIGCEKALDEPSTGIGFRIDPPQHLWKGVPDGFEGFGAFSILV